MNSDNIHEELIKRFLQRLDWAAQALGEPPDLRVEIFAGELTKSGAESSGGRYETGEICHSDCLIIRVPTKPHACALRLSDERFFEAARGLFSSMKFEWSDGDFGYHVSLSAPPPEELTGK